MTGAGELKRVLAEQRVLAAVPPAERTFGWWLGIQDLIREEVLLRQDGRRARLEARGDVGGGAVAGEGDSMKATITLPKPHAGQQRILDEARRFSVVCAGRRFGKSLLAEDRVIHTALSGKPAVWFAPNYRQLADAWRSLQQKLKPITKDKSETEHRLELRGGGSIEMWSLDNPDSGRGRAYQTVVVDECAIVPKLEEAWTENIRPMLADYQGSAWFLSTPKGTDSFFHRLWMAGQDELRADWASWQMPTSANPYISAEEIAAMKEDMPELAYLQEVEAQFVSWTGSVFRNIQACIAEPPGGVPYCSIGVDWAGSGRGGDYTCFVAVSTVGQVLGVDRFRGLPFDLQKARLEAFWRKGGSKSFIFCEQNSLGMPLLEALQQAGLPVCGFLTTAISKADGITKLALAFEQGRIRIPNDAVLLGELAAFEAKPLPSGLVRYGAASGAHDDEVMALMIAWAGLGLWEQQRSQPRFELLELPQISAI